MLAAAKVLLLDSSGLMQGFGTAAELRQQGLLDAATVHVAAAAGEAEADVTDITVSTAPAPAADALCGGGKAAEHTLVVPEDREIGVVSRDTCESSRKSNFGYRAVWALFNVWVFQTPPTSGPAGDQPSSPSGG